MQSDKLFQDNTDFSTLWKKVFHTVEKSMRRDFPPVMFSGGWAESKHLGFAPAARRRDSAEIPRQARDDHRTGAAGRNQETWTTTAENGGSTPLSSNWP